MEAVSGVQGHWRLQCRSLDLLHLKICGRDHGCPEMLISTARPDFKGCPSLKIWGRGHGCPECSSRQQNLISRLSTIGDLREGSWLSWMLISTARPDFKGCPSLKIWGRGHGCPECSSRQQNLTSRLSTIGDLRERSWLSWMLISTARPDFKAVHHWRSEGEIMVVLNAHLDCITWLQRLSIIEDLRERLGLSWMLISRARPDFKGCPSLKIWRRDHSCPECSSRQQDLTSKGDHHWRSEGEIMVVLNAHLASKTWLQRLSIIEDLRERSWLSWMLISRARPGFKGCPSLKIWGRDHGCPECSSRD